ncbi:MAG: ABC transporter ATP-binding protein [Anaerolineales bacterium]|nr:MAG: ABC transporter ATP-binding protein [Anaerolineales bacterium]
MKVLLRVFGYMRRYRPSVVVACICMLGIAGVRLIRPQLIRTVVDVGIGENQPDVLAQSAGLLLALTAAQGLLRFGERYLSEKVSQGIAYTMRNQVYRKLQSLSFSYHDRTQTGQLLSRATSDVERLRRATGRAILGLVASIVLLVGSGIMIFRMNVMLAALSMLLMPVIFQTVRRYMQRIHPMWHARRDQVAVLTSRLEQNLRGVAVVRGFAQEPAEIDRYDRQNDTIYRTSMTVARASALTWPFVFLLASASSVMVLWLGGRLVIGDQLTLGELVAFNSYLMQLMGPMRRLGFIMTGLAESRASAERVFEILDAQSEVEDAPDAEELPPMKGEVVFEDVTFSYGYGSEALSDISFRVDPGQIVALLGPTGSGKSTVINLLPRFYEATSGTIRVDGIPVGSVTLESLRRQIGIVLQETMLFGSSIRDNITFGRPDATQEEIEVAARAAAAHDFIMAMPDGYDTEVGERGVTLSGGQRQRIAIARALLLDPRILILDDATSSVDTETEQRIQEALAVLMQDRTCFVIAQRVSTVRNADLILVLDHGRLVAQGRHGDLIRESGIYADIYYRQLRPEDGRIQPAFVRSGR